MSITFDISARNFILDAFNINTNADGFLLTKDGKYFPSLSGNPVHISQFAGVINKNGEAVLVTRNIVDLIEASDIIKT